MVRTPRWIERRDDEQRVSMRTSWLAEYDIRMAKHRRHYGGLFLC
jgi:hypothetical protein